MSAVATSPSGRTSDPAYTSVTRDSIPPTVDLQVPETVAPGVPAAGLVTATDNRVGTVEVQVSIDGGAVGAPGPAPYAFEVLAPTGTPSGTTLVVTATATDVAGNPASVSEGVKVAGEGVVVGQVLADETSLPLAGATVALEAASGAQTATTDEHGRFRFLAGDPEVRVQASQPERTTVDREVAVTAEVGTVVVDARLTPLAEAVGMVDEAVDVRPTGYMVNCAHPSFLDADHLGRTAIGRIAGPEIPPVPMARSGRRRSTSMPIANARSICARISAAAAAGSMWA